jgi:hypothetical protein
MSGLTIPIFMLGGAVIGGIVGYLKQKYQVPKQNEGKQEMPNDYDYDPPKQPSKKPVPTKKAPPPLN